MIIVMAVGATELQTRRVAEAVAARGFEVHRSTGVNRTILGAVGGIRQADLGSLDALDGVERVLRVSGTYELASREFRPDGTVVSIPGVSIGGDELAVMAGPCAVESEEQVNRSAAAVKRAGATVLRGGAFKPRSSPYSFRGLGVEGLRLLRAAADAHGLRLVTEVMDVSQIDVVSRYADILQVGARNMHNFTLLQELGRARTPVLLKRGMAATIEEWLLAAEYLLAGGNEDVILCERGIRTFERETRNTLDLSAIPVVKALSHLPVIADPSHGIGRREHVGAMARAAVAAGADGLLIEVHCNPEAALSDGAQSLTPLQFERLMAELRAIVPALGRRFSAAAYAPPEMELARAPHDRGGAGCPEHDSSRTRPVFSGA